MCLSEVIVMIERMKALVRERNTCVLATAWENSPHCSLMSYVTDPDCRTIYMVTHRQTKKYRNLIENPKVSLLIDTREGTPGMDRTAIEALTVTGTFSLLTEPGQAAGVRKHLLARHPHLQEFLADPLAEVFAVRIESFQLLEGIQDATFVALE
jgi:nitroimidazol reductase NimA-like FMN-containing flavoprotein (pyridoxamine 5'-phosphate oxidase superfamily)